MRPQKTQELCPDVLGGGAPNTPAVATTMGSYRQMLAANGRGVRGWAHTRTRKCTSAAALVRACDCRRGRKWCPQRNPNADLPPSGAPRSAHLGSKRWVLVQSCAGSRLRPGARGALHRPHGPEPVDHVALPRRPGLQGGGQPLPAQAGLRADTRRGDGGVRPGSSSRETETAGASGRFK